MSPSLEDLLGMMLERRGSDLHLKAGRPPLFRISGKIVPTELEPLEPEQLEGMMHQLMSPRLRERFEADRAVDFSYAHGDRARFRINAFYQRGQVGAVLRAVPLRVPSLDQLYLPPVVQDLALSPSGLVLVTGPTGSGKTTTLAGMVEHINERRQVHVITLEDPIEFVYRDRNCVINQREVGIDAPSFAEALKHALRQDPDVILLGEMRDAETIATAVTAAETGHLVLSTLHTNNAAQTLDRVVDSFPAAQQRQVRLQLAQVLRGVVSQRLVPMASRPGRVAAVEVMVNSPQVHKCIVDADTGRLDRVIEESSAFYRMQTLNQSLAGLVSKALITVDAAEAVSLDPDELHRHLRRVAVPAQA